MSRLAAFALGAAGAAALTALVLSGAPPPGAGPNAVYWQARAQQAEQQLSTARRELASVSAQLQSLTTRFEAVSARLEALARAAPQALERPHRDVELSPAAAQPTSAVSPEFQPIAPEQWEALVGGTLHSEIERRLGHALPPENEQRLLDTLTRLRAASTAIDEESGPTPSAESQRSALMRSIVLMEADRAFREELGVGVAEFLRGLDPSQVEDVR